MKEPKKADTNSPKTSTKPTEAEPKQYSTTPKTVTPRAKTQNKYRYNKRQFGRPSKYKPIYCVKMLEYFDREHTEEVEETHTNRKGETWSCFKLRAIPVPTMQGFAVSIGTHPQRLIEWASHFPDFQEAYSRAQALQINHLATVTGLGLYNSNWAVFMAKNISSWRDKRDVEHSGQVDSSIFINKMASKAEQAIQDEQDIHINRLN